MNQTEHPLVQPSPCPLSFLGPRGVRREEEVSDSHVSLFDLKGGESMSATECQAAIGQIRLKDLQTAVRVWITLRIYNSHINIHLNSWANSMRMLQIRHRLLRCCKLYK